ncbi:antA/AntB antirepressor family protein [Neisseria sp.]|uniref:antA/AntB antirepressor family protein n=1 Tax=Neisseria sp. TaxID=192066 RepID=UPI0035A1A486
MNNQNLIPVFNGKLSDSSENLLCDARKLHDFLQVKSNFTTWIARRIEEYGFVENQDFLVFQNWNTKNGQRGGNRKAVSEYHITLDMAKELAMVERNEQGRAARRYFIECEKKLHQAQRPSEKKRLPATVKRHIRNREDLSFTRRDEKGNLINWFPPTDERGMYDWYEAYAVGEAWFGEVVELAGNNPQEAYHALRLAARLMADYARDTAKQGLGFVEGFFDKMARYTLAAVIEHRSGVVFPFAVGLNRLIDLAAYLKNAAPLPDNELRWQAWTESEACRHRCYEMKLAELSGLQA